MNTIYLVDMVTLPNNLHAIIDKQDPTNTVVYAFCGVESPRVPLCVVPRYSEWVQQNRLHIIETSPSGSIGSKQSVKQSLAFWAGKLIHQHPVEQNQFFIASDDSDMYVIAVWLRREGYTVQTSWPDPDSVVCDDDTLCTILRLVQKIQHQPKTLGDFVRFLKEDCCLPPYISLDSVIKKMQQQEILTLYKGAVHFQFPVFLDNTLESSVSEQQRPEKSDRRRRRDTRIPDPE